MSDWSLYEIENIAWNEVGNSDDHIVPHQGVEQVNEYVTPGEALKKPHHDVENVGNNTDGRGSATKTALGKKEETYLPMKLGRSIIPEGLQSHESENIVPASCDTQFITSASALASQANRGSGEYANDCIVDADNNFCSQVPTLQSVVSADGSRSCHLSLDHFPLAVNSLDFLENENVESENDLMYYDLPDIHNFEDTDGMFRIWDATLGPDELSWFSSSANTVYASEVNFKLSFQSSCSEFSALNNTLGHHGADTNFLPKSDQPFAHHDKSSSLCCQSYTDWLDSNTEYKGESALSEQINIHPKNMVSHYLSEGKRKQWYADQNLLSSAISTGSSPDSSKQTHFLEAAPSHMHTINLHPELEYSQSTHLVPFPQAASSVKFEKEIGPFSSYKSTDNVMNCALHCMDRLLDEISRPPTMTPKEKLEKLHDSHQLCTKMVAEHIHQQAYFTSKSSLQKKRWEYQHELLANCEVENISLEPAAEKDSSIVKENSCMTSACPDGVSLEATSFRQLQDVMDQLDIRTKLCIRDSLYRLAKNAEQRHGIADTKNCSKASKDTRVFQGTKEPKECAEFMDPETVTNPIDRSIAHLLFTSLPEPASRSIAGRQATQESNQCKISSKPPIPSYL